MTQGIARSAAGVRMGDMKSLQDGVGGLTNSDYQGPLTAHAGGGQANATQLIGGTNYIGTAATAADSVQLPAATPGTRVYLGNGGASTVTVYGKYGRTDTIDGTAGATGVSLATTKNAVYFCAVRGAWRSILTA